MIGQVFQILGSLALFLYGMRVMSEGIQKAAGERLHTIMNYMTVNRFAAVLTGFSVTALIQSSSATTVIVVSFVNAGLLTLRQAIGVIMGANIGTTVTGWVVALIGFKFNISSIALPAIALGMVLLFARKLGKREWGEALIGFGLLFLGLKFLKSSVPDIRSHPEALAFLARYTGMGFRSFLFFVLVGTVVTIVVQSSSAAMAVTLTMAYAGWIDFPTAAAIVLGENIGTTVTAYLASFNTRVNARRAARVHLLFNVIGVVWMAMVFPSFLRLVDWVVPGSMAENGDITAHLAMFHTLFNIANTLLFIGFVPQLASVAERLVKPRPEEQRYRLQYLSAIIQDTPEINILNAKQEIVRMSEIVQEMFSMFLAVFHNPEKKMKSEVEQLKEMEEYTDQMQEEISKYLVECSGESLSEHSAIHVNAMIRVVGELESIGDSCFNLIILAQRRYDKKLPLPPRVVAEMEPYFQSVGEFLDFNYRHLDERLSRKELEQAYQLEDRINGLRSTLKGASQRRLKKGADVRAELLYLDILRHIEHIGDYSLNISQALRMMR